MHPTKPDADHPRVTVPYAYLNINTYSLADAKPVSHFDAYGYDHPGAVADCDDYACYTHAHPLAEPVSYRDALTSSDADAAALNTMPEWLAVDLQPQRDGTFGYLLDPMRAAVRASAAGVLRAAASPASESADYILVTESTDFTPGTFAARAARARRYVRSRLPNRDLRP